MLMYGTTMFLVDVVREPAPSPGCGPPGRLPGTYCLAAGMATSGAVTGWLRDLTGADYGTLVAEAAELPPGPRGW
ncbi:hypothetical protein NKH77_04525 [Streptomyces sp. M19]